MNEEGKGKPFRRHTRKALKGGLDQLLKICLLDESFREKCMSILSTASLEIHRMVFETTKLESKRSMDPSRYFHFLTR